MPPFEINLLFIVYKLIFIDRKYLIKYSNTWTDIEFHDIEFHYIPSKTKQNYVKSLKIYGSKLSKRITSKSSSTFWGHLEHCHHGHH